MSDKPEVEAFSTYTNVSRYRDTIRFRGFVDGERTQFECDFKPTLFVTSNAQSQFRSLRTNRFLEVIQPGSISECYEFLNAYKDVQKFEVCGESKWELNFIGTTFGSKTPVPFDMTKLRIAVVDIEVSCEAGYPVMENPVEEIQVITVYDSYAKEYHVFVQLGQEYQKFQLSDEWVKNNKLSGKVIVHPCESGEEELVHLFLEYWDTIRPDIVTGWNVRFFDMPYIWHRIIEKYGEEVALKLSPWRAVNERKIEKWGKEYVVLDIQGMAVLDFYELYRKYTGANQESYKLDYIAQLELNRSKVAYDEFDSIKDFYTRAWQRFVEYNIIDVDLVKCMEDKLRMIELHVSVSYYARINFNDCFSQVRTWESILRHAYHTKGIICPFGKEVGEKSEEYEGAYVKEPKLGFSRWIMSFDLNSLYPSLIIQNNIGPETIIDASQYPPGLQDWLIQNRFDVNDLLEKRIDTSILKELDICMSANAEFFRKDKESVLVAVVKSLYEDRKREKNQMLECQNMVAAIEKELEKREGK